MKWFWDANGQLSVRGITMIAVLETLCLGTWVLLDTFNH